MPVSVRDMRDDSTARGPISERALSYEDMWREMIRVVDRVFGVLESETVMDECLDILIELLGATRGLIVASASDGSLQCMAGRGVGSSTALEREDVAKTLIRRALAAGKCVVSQSGDDEAPLAATSLGVVGAIAAPLYARADAAERGALYLDFRDTKTCISALHIEFFTATALLLGSVLAQHGRFQVTREELHAARSRHVESDRGFPLGALLRPDSMQGVRRELESALHSDCPILILGESGTGKTALARAIADASGRKPVVRAVLGSSDDLNTITSELFGHEKGAYSGATTKRMGLVEFARGGTLILDEILNLPAHAQKLLLDFTQFGSYRPLGYDRAEPKKAKLRLIAATNGDLGAAMQAGRFREDLYHRLASVILEMPALRERREDVPMLAECTLSAVDSSRRWTLSLELRRLLLSPALDWPGNVRQLEQAVLRARERAILHDRAATVLEVEHFDARYLEASAPRRAAEPEPVPLETSLSSLWKSLQGQRSEIGAREARVIQRALAESGGIVAQAARALGVARTTLASRMDALGMRVGRRDSAVHALTELHGRSADVRVSSIPSRDVRDSSIAERDGRDSPIPPRKGRRSFVA